MTSCRILIPMCFLVDESKPKQVSTIDTFREMIGTLLDPVEKALGLRNLFRYQVLSQIDIQKTGFKIVLEIECAERFALLEQAQAC